LINYGGIIMAKQKIKLSKEKETLLVPLYCKACEYEKEKPIIKDEKAKEIIERVEYNFTELDVPNKTCVTLNIRANKLDEYVNQYIISHKNPTIIHLGCGLDNRYGRIKDKNINFYDLDYQEVIELKKNFYQENTNYHFISSSVTDLDWINEVGEKPNVLIVAEGLFMYIAEEELKKLFNTLQEQWLNAHLIFDAYSKYTVKNIDKHASIRKTGAEIKWGIDDPQEIEDWNDNIKLVEEWYFTDYQQTEKLSPLYKLAFKAAGLFKMAKKAHRILYYEFKENEVEGNDST